MNKSASPEHGSAQSETNASLVEELDLTLPELTQSALDGLDTYNDAYYRLVDGLIDSEYDGLDNSDFDDTLSAEELLVAKRNRAGANADKIALESVKTTLRDQWMKTLAPELTTEDEAYEDTFESLMTVIVMDREEWKGSSNTSGNHITGLYDELSESVTGASSTVQSHEKRATIDSPNQSKTDKVTFTEEKEHAEDKANGEALAAAGITSSEIAILREAMEVDGISYAHASREYIETTIAQENNESDEDFEKRKTDIHKQLSRALQVTRDDRRQSINQALAADSTEKSTDTKDSDRKETQQAPNLNQERDQEEGEFLAASGITVAILRELRDSITENNNHSAVATKYVEENITQNEGESDSDYRVRRGKISQKLKHALQVTRQSRIEDIEAGLVGPDNSDLAMGKYSEVEYSDDGKLWGNLEGSGTFYEIDETELVQAYGHEIKADAASAGSTELDAIDNKTPEDIAEGKLFTKNLREQYAKKLSDRSKKIGFFERKSKTESIESDRAEYSEMLSALATEMMFELESAGKSEDEIAEEIDRFVSMQMNLFVAKMEHKRSASFKNMREGFIKNRIKQWASWGPKDGANLKERIFSINNAKKAAVFAIPGLGIGAATVALAPAAAAGAGVAGVIVASTYISRTIGRNLAGAKLDGTANAVKIAKAQSQDIAAGMASVNESATEDWDAHKANLSEDERKKAKYYGKSNHELMMLLAEERAAEFHDRNNRRLIGGTAIGLAAGLLGKGFAEAVANTGAAEATGDWIADKTSAGYQGVKNWFNAPVANISETVDKPQPTTSEIFDNPDAMPNASSPELPVPESGAVDNSVEIIAETEPETETIADYIERHEDGATIDSGEGLYSTFADFHISSDHHAELLQKVGPELQDMGVAYRMEDGLWGLNYAGELPDDASKLIVSTAEQNGWVDLDTMSEASDSSQEIATTTLNETFTVEPGHGYTHEIMDAAEAENVDISAVEAYDTYTDMVDAEGRDFIDLEGVNGADVYSMGDGKYEIGISAPTEATWTDGAQEIMADRFGQNVDVESRGTNESIQANESDALDEVRQDNDVLPDVTVAGETFEAENVAAVTDKLSQVRESGNYAQLNEYMRKYDFVQEFANSLAGLEFPDGTEIVRATENIGDSNYLFVNGIDGQKWPEQVENAIDAFLDKYDLAS